MPFILPGAAVGAGVALIMWGGRSWINGDDSADQAAAKVIRAVPDYFVKHVDDVEVTSDGIKMRLKKDAPDSAVHEARRNIKVEDRADGVDVYR